MKRSSGSLTVKFKLLEDRRRILRSVLVQGRPIIVGNVYDVMRRCGNPSCHCAAKPGHRQTLLIYADDGRRRCKFVRQADAQWVKQAWTATANARKRYASFAPFKNVSWRF